MSRLQRRRIARRRLVLVVGCVVVLLAISVAANYGPLQHYRDARARAEKAAVEVASLEKHIDEMRAQLGKLSQSAYLEDMARRQLTYTLPGEDLYIVKGASEGAAATAGVPGSEAVDTPETGQVEGPDAGSGGTESHRPGPLERMVLGVAGLF
ncbi:MAG: FtsB family cell division protein [Thermoleophilia bacterium]